VSPVFRSDTPTQPRGGRTKRVEAHVAPEVAERYTKAANYAGFRTRAEWICAVLDREVDEHGWRKKFAAQQGIADPNAPNASDDPDDRGLSDEPTESFDLVPAEPIRARAQSTLPPESEEGS
jgi:hypothetical protein